MAMQDLSDTTEVQPPDFLLPGIRCALEMVIAATLILYLGLPAGNDFYTGFVLVLAFMVMVVILFWSLNQQMEAWIARTRRVG